jgi:hypothetical protein
MRWVAGLVAITGYLALMPADALADTQFRGKSGQGKVAKLHTGDDGLVQGFAIGWRAPCQRPRFRYIASTRFVPAYDASTADRFVDADAYRERFKNGVRAILSVRVVGARVSERRWRGTFRISARVFRGSRQIDRCHARTRWRVAARTS